MKTIRICNVIARAERLNQLEMVDWYREKACNEDTSKVMELTDEDHAYLNSLWDEKSGMISSRKPCKKNKPSKPQLNEWTIYSNILRKQGTEQQIKELDRIEKWIKTQSSCGCAGNTKVKQAKKDFMNKYCITTKSPAEWSVAE